MTFDEACGIKNPRGISFSAKYQRYMDRLGQENVRKFVPGGLDRLIDAYLADRDLNNIPLREWEKAAGYPGAPDRQGGKPPKCSGPFARLLTSNGITLFSSSECVCLLKYAAEQMVLEALAAAYKRQSLQDLECWAVFERWNSRPDGLSRNNIFDHDCVALFPDESAAISFEMDNPEHRVRKLIHDTRSKKEVTADET